MTVAGSGAGTDRSGRGQPPAPAVTVRREADGILKLSSPIALPPVAQSLAHLFDAVAAAGSDAPFVRQREADGGWRTITYGAAKRAADGLGQWLIDQGLGPGDVVSYLSEPSIEHAIAAIGVQRSGAAIAPVSVAYSLSGGSLERLRACVEVVGARVVIVDDAARYADALLALGDLGLTIVAKTGAISGLTIVPWDQVLATVPTPALAARMAAITPDAIARIMYTSGSTGSPKAAPQPHANLTITVAQTQALGMLDFDGERPQFLEAMPFSHIMAGNFNLNNVIAAGGTIWIDDGKPTPVLFERTLANLRDVSPHFFITVPLGYRMLCDAMERDAELRDRFFANLRYIGFGGAVLPNSVRDRLLALSRAALGHEIPIYAFYGATEYLFGTLKYWEGGDTDVIGLPLPLTELKLVPNGDRYEMLVRGPTLMPRTGYIGAAGASEELFDEEGFFRTGDAVRFADPDEPTRGLVFAGRTSDDFKLSSGTFVKVTELRNAILAATEGLVSEVVLCGLNQDQVGALVWLAPGADPAALASGLARFNAQQGGSASRIGRALVQATPPAFDVGEVTVKGNVAFRVVREQRAEEVARLFAEPPGPGVIDLAVES